MRVILRTTLALPSGELCCQCVETLTPELSERLEPHVDLLKWCCLYGIESASPFRSNRRETALPQNAKMLRDRRLGYPKLFLDDSCDRA
jgi:hypothetical protein